jgi:Ca-activated chloride channel family protein
MFAVHSPRRSPAFIVGTVIVAVLLGCSAFPFNYSSKAFNLPGQSAEGVQFELPANGNLRVENPRGSVFVEVWNQTYLSVAAVSDSGESIPSPAVIHSTASLVSVRVPAGAARASQVNLRLRIPARTHAAILTTNGAVEVKGVPAALLMQTVSGEARLEVPATANASIVAESKTGTVVSTLRSARVNQTERPQVRGSIGSGANTVRIFSGAGNITLAAASAERASSSGGTTFTTTPAQRPSATPRETRATNPPELTGQDPNRPAAGTPAQQGPQEVSEDDVVRVDTELVSVNVSVVDRGTSRVVNDLTKNDFRLWEDNAAQEIRHFESASAPFNLVLLIDLSGSTTRVVDLIKSAALHFVEAARPFDRIAVITFAGDQVVVSPLTTDHAALAQRINGIQRPDGSTKLYDSLAFAMDEVAREAKDARRNAIVVISDGMDSVMPNVTGEGSSLSYQEMLRQAREFDGIIYSIWTDTQSYEPLSPKDIQQETFDLGHDQLKELAEAGGGAFYECEQLQDLAGAYDRVVADLGTLYTLSYRSTKKIRDGTWRTIRVNVNRTNSVARAKRGYYAK